jgi:hypothetical protein
LHDAFPEHEFSPLHECLSATAPSGVVGLGWLAVDAHPTAPSTAPVNAAAINLSVKLMVLCFLLTGRTPHSRLCPLEYARTQQQVSLFRANEQRKLP